MPAEPGPGPWFDVHDLVRSARLETARTENHLIINDQSRRHLMRRFPVSDAIVRFAASHRYRHWLSALGPCAGAAKGLLP
jgi:hypothetical protein